MTYNQAQLLRSFDYNGQRGNIISSVSLNVSKILANKVGKIIVD